MHIYKRIRHDYYTEYILPTIVNLKKRIRARQFSVFLSV